MSSEHMDTVSERESRTVRPGQAVRFRHSAAITVAAVVAFIGAVPLAATFWPAAPILLVPLAVALWGWRSGTDADRHGLRIRALVGTRRIAWDELVELGTDHRGGAFARLGDASVIALPAVRRADLAQLVAASGTELGTAAR